MALRVRISRFGSKGTKEESTLRPSNPTSCGLSQAFWQMLKRCVTRITALSAIAEDWKLTKYLPMRKWLIKYDICFDIASKDTFYILIWKDVQAIVFSWRSKMKNSVIRVFLLVLKGEKIRVYMVTYLYLQAFLLWKEASETHDNGTL